MGFGCNGFGWGGWMGMGGGWIGLILNVALFTGALILVGLAVAWLIRQFRRLTPTAEMAPDPLEIVRRRLAAGEINIAEFEEIRERLHS
ncbi:MAG: SHOCT domain-containing protein [Chloroflexota bacterium]|nr:SHOCT domain-containing protein [Chloroflexota bacterium]